LNDSTFQITAPGLDTQRIVEEIRASVAERMANGQYTDSRVARAERMNLSNLKDQEDFLPFYLECLREAVFVDISDFDILERRATLPKFFIGLKRFVWKLLKFYTYRLWSQQNQVNGLLLSAVEGTENRYRDKIKDLEDRIAELEARDTSV